MTYRYSLIYAYLLTFVRFRDAIFSKIFFSAQEDLLRLVVYCRIGIEVKICDQILLSEWMVIYSRICIGIVVSNLHVEFYFVELLVRSRNCSVECGSNPSSNSRWPFSFFALLKYNHAWISDKNYSKFTSYGLVKTPIHSTNFPPDAEFLEFM